MSLILDALKKLDRENSSRRDRATNIAAGILGTDLPRPGKRIRPYVTIVFLTAAAAALITYGVIVKFGFQSKSSSPSPLSPQTAEEKITAAFPLREPVHDDRRDIFHVSPGIQVPAEIKKKADIQVSAENRKVLPAPSSRESVPEGRDEPGRVPPKIEKPAEGKKPAEIDSPAASKKKSVTPQGEKKASQNAQSVGEGITSGGAEKTAERTPNLSVAITSSLKISGIVWDEEPSRRIAVINGIYAKEGSIIEGVKILEIFLDRVRFSREGLSFEIPFR